MQDEVLVWEKERVGHEGSYEGKKEMEFAGSEGKRCWVSSGVPGELWIKVMAEGRCRKIGTIGNPLSCSASL